jgi:carboxylate-amine ligase
LLEHRFTGPEFTVGIEEELMILDPETWALSPSIDRLIAAMPEDIAGQVHPELHKSVLEIATSVCQTIGEAGAELADLRRAVIAAAEGEGLTIGAAATHPFAIALEQETVDRERYRALLDELGMIARREVIFGTHCHVAIEDPDRAIYVADGIRRYLPLFLALSVNSPFWEGERTGLMSSRVPIFRAFPREGIPPHYGTWEIYSYRVGQMMRAGAIADYTFMWWDVRTHAKLGTVETRIFDQQTRVESTVALAALNTCLAHRLCRLYDQGEPLV